MDARPETLSRSNQREHQCLPASTHHFQSLPWRLTQIHSRAQTATETSKGQCCQCPTKLELGGRPRNRRILLRTDVSPPAITKMAPWPSLSTQALVRELHFSRARVEPLKPASDLRLLGTAVVARSLGTSVCVCVRVYVYVYIYMYIDICRSVLGHRPQCRVLPTR